MTQTTILLFTLGLLAGLPAGYWLAWMLDPDEICILILRAFGSLFFFGRKTREFELVTAHFLWEAEGRP